MSAQPVAAHYEGEGQAIGNDAGDTATLCNADCELVDEFTWS